MSETLRSEQLAFSDDELFPEALAHPIDRIPLAERLDKLTRLAVDHEMTPHGYKEMNHMAYLTEQRYALGGAAAYVSMIVRRNRAIKQRQDQELPTIEPVALRLAANFIDFYDDAVTTMASLQDLNEQRSRVRFSSKSIDDLTARLLDDDTLRRGAGTLLSYEDINMFLLRAGDDYLSTDYAAANDLLLHRQAHLLQGSSSKQLDNRINFAFTYERNRAAFWSDQIYGAPGDSDANLSRRRGLIDIQSPSVQALIQKRFLHSS